MRADPRTSRARGSALVPALLFSIVVMVFIMSIVMSGVAVNDQKRSLGAAQVAHDAAESGIHHLVAGLAGPERVTILGANGFVDVLRGDPTSERAIAYEVAIRSGGDDGVDNDLDGLVDEEDEADMFEAESTGTADGIDRTVRVTLLARYRTPGLQAATYIADPTASMNLAGNAFLISGRDVDSDGVDTGLLVPGIGVAGDTTNIIDQVNRQQDDNIVGLGGDFSVHSVAELDFTQLIEDAVRSANVQLTDGDSSSPTAPGEWGTLEAPAIVFGQGSIHISGNAVGAGLIVVDGDLTISGSFEWHGLVIVRGRVNFTGGGDAKRIVGGLVVERDVLSGETGLGSEGAVRGNVEIHFSQETLLRISTAFATYTVMNWREGANPEVVE